MRMFLAVTFALVLLWPRPAYNQQSQTHKNTTRGSDASSQSTPETPPIPDQAKAPATATPEPQQETINDPVPWWRRSEWIIVVITGVYTLISLGTLIAIRGQAALAKEQIALIKRGEEATNKAVSAAEKSAEAAMVSAKSLINSNRAWLLVTTENKVFQPWIFDLRATNHGDSPAEILWVYEKEVVVNFGEQLPPEPYYGESNTVFANRKWIPSGENFDIRDLNIALPAPDDPVTFAALRDGAKWLWSYGIVRYRDSLSRDVHESRFCYLVNFNTGPLMSGPSGYNDCT